MVLKFILKDRKTTSNHFFNIPVKHARRVRIAVMVSNAKRYGSRALQIFLEAILSPLRTSRHSLFP